MKLLFEKFPLISRLLFLLVLPLSVIGCCAYFFLSQQYLPFSGPLRSAELDAQVNVLRGPRAIVKIKANSELDSYYALGFLHARDRAWQMEMNRRLANGTLSEILGDKFLGADRLARTIGLRENAKRMLAGLNQQNRAILDKYVKGVNAGIADMPILPLEYYIAGYEPEPWTALDSLSTMQWLTWHLAGNFSNEMQKTQLIQLLGKDKALELAGTNYHRLKEALEQPGQFADNEHSLFELDSQLRKLLAVKTAVGSNSWVVSGKYTQSGAPLLANDPHLGNTIPSMWYLANMEGGTLQVSGATMPGLPFVVIGHNRHIAWGITNMMADTQDVMLLDINPVNSNQYKLDGVYQEMSVRNEEIRVKRSFLQSGRKSETLAVRSTIFGPVISDLGQQLDQFSYSLQWTGATENGASFNSFVRLNKARNWEEFEQALSGLIAPILAMTYADTHGDIGLIAPGRYPIRKQGSGAIPQSGTNSAHLWSSWLPYSEVPKIKNPPSGILVAANHNFLPGNYTHYISSDWVADHRAKRIQHLLQQRIASGQPINSQYFEQMQTDTFSPAWFNLKDQMLAMLAQPLLDQHPELTKFDGNVSEHGQVAALWLSWIEHLNRLVVEDDFLDRFGMPKRSLLSGLVEQPNIEMLTNILSKSDEQWCDYGYTDERESCQNMVNVAFLSAKATVASQSGLFKSVNWSELHKATYDQIPYGEVVDRNSLWLKLLPILFNRYTEHNGSWDSIDVSTPVITDRGNYRSFYGASYRQVVNLTESIEMHFSNITGQSGNVLSPHYDDMISTSESPVGLVKDVGFTSAQESSEEER